jgi:hypothetical protein
MRDSISVGGGHNRAQSIEKRNGPGQASNFLDSTIQNKNNRRMTVAGPNVLSRPKNGCSGDLSEA